MRKKEEKKVCKQQWTSCLFVCVCVFLEGEGGYETITTIIF